jgi:hypothetical protein
MGWKYRKWTLRDNEVLAVIKGTIRFSKNGYYRIENGVHVIYPVFRRLKELGMSEPGASKLVKQAVAAKLIPWGKYPGKPREPKPETSPYVQGKLNDDEEEEPSKKNPQFSLVERGEFWGIFNAQDASVRIISRDRYEAKQALARLLQSEKKEPLFKRSKQMAAIIFA